MRLLIVLALTAFWASTASAAVFVDVYLADEQTPLSQVDPNIPGLYRDIMVGTRLTLVIRSETERFWAGLLWSSWEDWAVGSLCGRDYRKTIVGNRVIWGNYEGSCLEGAGPVPFVQDVEGLDGAGMVMNCMFASPESDWFILDYYAHEVGECSIGFYERFPSSSTQPAIPVLIPPPPPPSDDSVLLAVLGFNHVPSRDYSGDTIVNFIDFAIMAGQWRRAVEADPVTAPSSDLNADDSIGLPDLTLFCEYWLERTDVNVPTDDPKDIIAGP